ncbi:hypothetical protein OROGR_008487 [Orobanche gracilis]
MSTCNLVAESVWQAVESTRSDDQLSILHFIYGKNLDKATRILDQRGVKRISGEPSGRSIFQVVGESRKKEEYLCFPEHYCACYSFFYDIVNKGDDLCMFVYLMLQDIFFIYFQCKHQLAARLASSTGTCIEVKVSDEDLALLLSEV